MTIREVADTLYATPLTQEVNWDKDVHTACGSDMMSDVLAYVKDQAILITGLNNPQVIRTASMMDMVCVVYVRGKQPDAATLALAQQLDIVVLATEEAMFSACGLLYAAGLRGGK